MNVCNRFDNLTADDCSKDIFSAEKALMIFISISNYLIILIINLTIAINFVFTINFIFYYY